MVCKLCGTENNAGADVCSFCGHTLNPVTIRRTAPVHAPRVINSTPTTKVATVPVHIFYFFREFISQPVTAMQNHRIKTGEALFFAVLEPISLFLLLLVIAGHIKEKLQPYTGIFTGSAIESYLSFLSDETGMFFGSFIIYIGSFITFLLISAILGKFIFKGFVDLNKLFSFTVVSHIPLTLSFVLSMVLVLFSIRFVVFALIIGIISSIVIGTFAFAASFNISYDKCVYCSFFTYLAQSAALYIFVPYIIK